MTGQQIKWASTHDWFHNANGDVVYVKGDVVMGEPEVMAFNNFKELREWAGY